MAKTNNRALTLRTITQENSDAILEVYRQCEDFLALGPEPKASAAMVLKDIRDCQGEGGVFQGIYTADGCMVGVISYVAAGFKGKASDAFISLLMIAAPFRRRGSGKEIVQRIESEIRQNPCINSILSAVQVNNPDAIKFWQKNGYKIVGGPELRPDKTTVYRLRKDLKGIV
jgi:ribosomal protein S18 acetylase RimI-like enzyme